MHSRYVCAVPVLHVGKKKWSRERGAYHFGVARRGDEELKEEGRRNLWIILYSCLDKGVCCTR
jgi:hypothetical protein